MSLNAGFLLFLVALIALPYAEIRHLSYLNRKARADEQ